MKFEKEYPATHSMSTAWFGIDEDGDVALIKFDDNGPVPFDCGDNGIEDVIAVIMSTEHENGSRSVFFTDEQALQMEKILEAPTIDLLQFYALVKINVRNTTRFKELCIKNSTDKKYSFPYLTLNEDIGLYVVDFFDWKNADRQYLIDNNIVLGVTYWETYVSDDWNEELKKWVFDVNFDGYPFFLYCQPYSTDQLTERTLVPRFPFRAEQLSDEVRRKALKFPLRFKDTPFVQIAEYLQADLNFDATRSEDDGVRTVEWDCLPLTDGGRGWIRRSILGDLDCSKCWKCLTDSNCGYVKLGCRQSGLHPTIMHLYAPEEKGDYAWALPAPYRDLLYGRPIGELVISMPIIGGVPAEKGNSNLFGREFEELLKTQDVNLWFANCRENFEESVRRLAPRVIVVSEAACRVIESVFDITDNLIGIEGENYPCFVMLPGTNWTTEIVRLAQLPYRGETPQRIKRIEN